MKKTGKVRRFEVETADNGGYSVRTHFYDSPEAGKGYIEPMNTVHKNLGEVKKHMETMCLQHDGSPKNSPPANKSVVKKAIINQAVESRHG